MTLDHIQISTAVAAIVGYSAAHAAGFLTKAHAPEWVFGAVTTVLGGPFFIMILLGQKRRAALWGR